MVGCHRTLGKGLAGKDGQTDIVIRAAGDKLGSNIFSSLYAVGLQVLSKHTGGDIHSKHDIDAFRGALAPTVLCLRACQHNDD